jgi:23S rRNA pseudouridine1911/1915/1917 synthase
MQLPTLFEDDYLIVVDKPSGLSTQQNATGTTCLLDCFGTLNVQPVYRLDQRVSGLIVLAKIASIQTQLTQAIQAGNFKKIYTAVVANKPLHNNQIINHWLLKNGSKVKAFAKPVAHSKKAMLTYTVVQSSNRYHLLHIELQTGKFHQIRAQLAAIGSPIVGDVKYGYKRTTTDGSIFLQCNTIEFIHPITKNNIRLQLPLPLAWQKLGIE